MQQSTWSQDHWCDVAWGPSVLHALRGSVLRRASAPVLHMYMQAVMQFHDMKNDAYLMPGLTQQSI